MRCDFFFFFSEISHLQLPLPWQILTSWIYTCPFFYVFLLYHYSLAKHWGTRAQEAIMNADRQLWVLSENEHKSIGACGWEETEKINSLPRQAKCVWMLFAHVVLMYKRIHLAWKCAGNDLCLTLYSVSKKNDENITPCTMRVLCKARFRLEPDREKLREQSLLPGNKAKRKIPKPLSSKPRWKSIRNYISVLQTCSDQGWEGFMGLLTSVRSSASKEKLSVWHIINFTKSFFLWGGF